MKCRNCHTNSKQNETRYIFNDTNTGNQFHIFQTPCYKCEKCGQIDFDEKILNVINNYITHEENPALVTMTSFNDINTRKYN